MFCSNCGKQMTDGSRFCEHCGQPAVQDSPVVQETIIVPELPESEIPVAPTMDRPTIIVPEIPDVPDVPVPPVAPPDPLTEIYPEKAPKKSKVPLIIGLVTAAVLLVAIIVVVALGISNDWWRAPVEEDDDPSPSSSTQVNPDPDPNVELTPEQLRAQLVEHNVGGLNVYLSEDFEVTQDSEHETVFEVTTTARSILVKVSHGSLSDADEDIDSSRDFAKYFEDMAEDQFDNVDRDKLHDIHYIICRHDDDNEVIICGFYVQDSYGWVIQFIVDDYDEAFVNYATLGLIDEDFVPPALEAAKQELGFNGLYLTLDDSFEVLEQDQKAVIYEGDSMNIYVSLAALSDFPIPIGSSQDFANYYYERLNSDDWTDVRLETADEAFCYVLTTDDAGWTTLTGLYVYDNCAWTVIGETRNFETDGEALVRFITSGRIEPAEVPVVEAGPQLVEFNGIQLELDVSYKEVFRDEEYVFLSHEMEVYIFTGAVSELDGTFANASQWAQAEYESYVALWDHIKRFNINGVDCLLLWDDAEGAASTAYGYYMVGDRWWMIQVNNASGPDKDEMLAITGGGVLTVKEDPPFEQTPLANRDRITMTDQLTAEYLGLQISYSPDWTVDDTWSPTGDYTHETMDMYTYRYKLEEQGATDAISFAWVLAEEWCAMWDSYEVGLAGGIPYVLMRDEDSDYFLVIGTYANEDSCWEIDIHCYDSELLNQAIWYATAGQILEGASAT